MKQIISSFMVGLMLLGSSQTVVYAAESNVQAVNQEVNKIDGKSLTDQLDGLYREVGKELKIDYMYVKILHILSGGKALYADRVPNIYSDITVDTIEGAFDIPGAKTNYDKKAEWAICPDSTVQRPSKYYVPDAAYNVTSDIVTIMNNRYYLNRGSMQPYFDSLKKEVKTNILFCEALLEYTGNKKEVVDSFYKVYEKILYDKKRDENVIQLSEEGKYEIKDKFKQIFINNGISDVNTLNNLAVVLSFDKSLAVNDSLDSLTDEYVLPYKVGYTSRENMMLAAMSVVGKVRYVWGGGHFTSGNIKGINPAWKMFYDKYPVDPSSPGFNRCIQPSNNWCPVHGAFQSGDACVFKSAVIKNVDEFILANSSVYDTTLLKDDKFKKLINDDVKFEPGFTAHRLDGLDCSGYTSWIYNQIDRTRSYDYAARWFIGESGLRSIPLNDKLLPGDIFSWTGHIVMVVGKITAGDKAYVMIEASPNTVKFGVLYHEGVTDAEMAEAKQIANEANALLGNLPASEKMHSNNMDRVGYSSAGRYAEVGRYAKAFIDENTKISGYNKTMKEMTAKEIIQHTIDNMPEEYLSGLGTYKGGVFNTNNRGKLENTQRGTRTDVVKTNGEKGLVDLGK